MAAPGTEPYPTPGRGWRLVVVLTAVSVIGFVDRQILSLLVAPIRRDLNISDTQMSLLLGFSFAVFFTLFSIPLGRLADRRSRRTVLAAGLAGWSACTALCGMSRTFGQMMLLRMGVGMGEATLNPCAHSMIADSFPENRRATAMSVFAMGMSVGSGLAFLLGGLVVRFASDRESWVLPVVGAVRPWQLVLLEVGLAGLMVTGLLYAIREPVRRGRNGGAGGVRLSEAAVYFRRNRRTFLHHHLGFALFALAATAGAAWIPEMFRRNFHWSIPKFGFYFGIEVAVCGCLGVVMAGRIADGMLRRGLVDANLRVGAAIAVLALPVNALVFLAPSGEWAIVWLAPGVALVSAPYGVAAAALQQALPGSLRSQGAALYVLSLNLIGAAIGPTLTAALNERLFGREDSLNYSLLIVHVAAFLASATLIWTGRRSFQETVARLRD